MPRRKAVERVQQEAAVPVREPPSVVERVDALWDGYGERLLELNRGIMTTAFAESAVRQGACLDGMRAWVALLPAPKVQRKYAMLGAEAALEAFALAVQTQIEWGQAFCQALATGDPALPVASAALGSRFAERRIRAIVIKFPDRRSRPWP